MKESNIIDSFVTNITPSSKNRFNNTYKFALARSLLDHCNEQNSKLFVSYDEIAQDFFEYYWKQECKYRLRQGPKNQPPIIIDIIRKEFPIEDTYPSYEKICKKHPNKVRNCIKKISEECFDDVIPRFQKNGDKLYTYKITKEYKDSADNKEIDPDDGITLKKHTVNVLHKNYHPLYRATILGWVRFLENRNFGMPNLTRKIDGRFKPSRNLSQFRKILLCFFDTCFYCRQSLAGRKIHVDHLLPFDYVSENEMWNLVVACQKCNCEKSSSLPRPEYVARLIRRNEWYGKKIKKLDDSTQTLTNGNQDIESHYDNAKKYGHMIWEKNIDI